MKTLCDFSNRQISRPSKTEFVVYFSLCITFTVVQNDKDGTKRTKTKFSGVGIIRFYADFRFEYFLAYNFFLLSIQQILQTDTREVIFDNI